MFSHRKKNILAALIFLIVAFGLHELRLHFIRQWFKPAAPLSVTLPNPELISPKKLRKVRVVLLDGLTAKESQKLGGWRTVCESGVRLHLEVGFPSVSLPVQHALWTGYTQQQSGVLLQIEAMAQPVFPSLPLWITRAGQKSIALADAHEEIIRSFPFSEHLAPKVPWRWSIAELTKQAKLAFASDAALVLVHTLSIDRAGHLYGAKSPAYQATAAEADLMLSELWRLRRPEDFFVVLSDHGHLNNRGHGDIEDDVFYSSACLAGPTIPSSRVGAASIIDLHRLLWDFLDLPDSPALFGKKLSTILSGQHSPSTTKWHFSFARLLLATFTFFLLTTGWLLSVKRLAKIKYAIPWYLLLALCCLLLGWGLPSLSRDYAYLKYPHMIATASILSMFVLIWQWRGLQPEIKSALVLAWPLLSLSLPLLIFTGYPLLRPPLFPFVTAWASTLLTWDVIFIGELGILLALARARKTVEEH